MNVEPASLAQFQRGMGGHMVEIDSDVGGVARDLKDIDPGLKVRFVEYGNPPFWAVYHESEDRRSTYLVLTQKAHQTASGAWAGLDQRIVRRVMEIGHSSYNFADEVDKQNRLAHKRRKQKFADTISETGDIAAHAVRKDLGLKYKGRIFT